MQEASFFRMKPEEVSPQMRMRWQLRKTISERGLSLNTERKITQPMRGKTEEEKEQIASKLLEEVRAGLWDETE